MITNIIFAVFLTMGMYFLLAQLFEVPTWRSVRTVLAVSQRGSKSKRSSLLYTIAQNYVGIVKISEYKRNRMVHTLKSINDSTTPEMYYAIGFTRFAISILIAVVLFFIFPLFGMVTLAIGIFVVFNHFRKPEKIMAERREKIEKELPVFASLVEQELANRHDVMGILETYQACAGEELKSELMLTLADMRAGNHENALTRLESRVGSNELSKIIRGLVRALTGDDALPYFQMLAGEFSSTEISKLRKETLKRPSKINKYSFFILMMAVATILTVLGVSILEIAPKLF